jgi:hypothetical protein
VSIEAVRGIELLSLLCFVSELAEVRKREKGRGMLDLTVLAVISKEDGCCCWMSLLFSYFSVAAIGDMFRIGGVVHAVLG